MHSTLRLTAAAGAIAFIALATTVGCGGGSPPESLTPGVRLNNPDVTKRKVEIYRDVGLVKETVICNDRTFAASRFVTVLDSKLNVIKRFPAATSEVPADKHIALSSDCSGVTLTEQFSKRDILVVHDIDGTKRTEIKLRAPARAVLAKSAKRNEPVVVAAQADLPVEVYGIEGARLGTFRGDCAGAIVSADLAGDESWEVVCGHAGGYSVHDVGGSEVAVLQSEPESFAIVRTPAGKSHIAIAGDTAIRVLRGDFSEIAALRLPEFDHYAPLDAAASNLGSHGIIYASLLGGRGGWHRTTLLLHSGDGRLLYHEVLDGDYNVVQPQAPGEFVLFGRGDAISYTFAPSAENRPPAARSN